MLLHQGTVNISKAACGTHMSGLEVILPSVLCLLCDLPSCRSNFICPDFWRTHPEHCGYKNSVKSMKEYTFLQDTLAPPHVGSCVFSFTNIAIADLPMCATGCVDVEMSW